MSNLTTLVELKNSLLKDCTKEIEAALLKYGCKLRATPSLVPDSAGGYRITANVELIVE